MNDVIPISKPQTDHVKIVFLHGIGDGNVKDAWFTALCASLSACGYPVPYKGDVIAPNYASLLDIEPPPTCPLPPATTPLPSEVDESDRLRWEYWRRQAALERLLADTETCGAVIGLPESLVECALAVPVLNY